MLPTTNTLHSKTVTVETRNIAKRRGTLNLSCKACTTTSSCPRKEVKAAKNIAKKKVNIKNWPKGIALNISGKVINKRAGPLFKSFPKANTAGIIINVANIETIVSAKTMYFAEEITSLSFFV